MRPSPSRRCWLSRGHARKAGAANVVLATRRCNYANSSWFKLGWLGNGNRGSAWYRNGKINGKGCWWTNLVEKGFDKGESDWESGVWEGKEKIYLFSSFFIYFSFPLIRFSFYFFRFCFGLFCYGPVVFLFSFFETPFFSVLFSFVLYFPRRLCVARRSGFFLRSAVVSTSLLLFSFRSVT